MGWTAAGALDSRLRGNPASAVLLPGVLGAKTTEGGDGMRIDWSLGTVLTVALIVTVAILAWEQWS